MQASKPVAGPWDALLRARPYRAPAAASEAPGAKAGTKLAALLAVLAERGSATTLTLAVCVELETRQVWGLLKGPREIGQVNFDNGRWSLAAGFHGREVERAAALLRARGWRVEAPA